MPDLKPGDVIRVRQHVGTRVPTVDQITVNLGALARSIVDNMIEGGFDARDMPARARYLTRQFSEAMDRDIQRFANTGKYPEYAERDEQEKATS